MAIKKAELEKMYEMLSNGASFAEIQRKFQKYDYWEIYFEIDAFSFVGIKRKITFRINKIAASKDPSERRKIASETKELFNELYARLRINSKKLIDIDRVLRKES